MKNIGWLTLTLASSFASGTLLAQSGTIDLWISPYSSGIGSEFTAVTSPALYQDYAPAAVLAALNGQTGFQTFCVQSEAQVSPGSGSYAPVTYNFTTSLGSTGPTQAYALTEGAAWLYSQFAQGKLANYDFANTGNSAIAGATGSRTTDSAALQAAIWFLQDGQTDANPAYASGGGPGNIYYNEAASALGLGLEANATASTDFGVEVMNLTDPTGAAAQDQLLYVGAPDNGGTLTLLTTSLAGLVLLVRRQTVTG